MIKLKAERKPPINRLNAILTRLVKQGVYSTSEAIKERGAWARIHRAKPNG